VRGCILGLSFIGPVAGSVEKHNVSSGSIKGVLFLD
jgi:hypothetical protein